MAINRLPKPERDGQIIEMRVNDYRDFLNHKIGHISHANSESTISLKTVKLIAVIYSCKWIGDDLQWELVL